MLLHTAPVRHARAVCATLDAEQDTQARLRQPLLRLARAGGHPGVGGRGLNYETPEREQSYVNCCTTIKTMMYRKATGIKEIRITKIARNVDV